MQIIKPTSFKYVIHSWLKAEWRKPDFDSYRNSHNEELIKNPNFSNETENKERLEILMKVRSPMLEPLPTNTEWYLASFDNEDIPNTFIVPSNDWETISNNKYHPITVIENLGLNDGHAKIINEIKNSLRGNNIDTRIILVASSLEGAKTIIEGNHRAVAIFDKAIEEQSTDPIIEEIYIGLSPNMKNYKWHIEQYLVPIQK